MDNEIGMALRAIISGLRYSGKIDDADCAAIISALGEVADKARANERRGSASRVDNFAADVARDSFGADHSIAIDARRRAEGRQ